MRTKGGWYEKAIFILNKDVSTRQKPKDIVQEAEKIIGDYMKRSSPQKSGFSTMIKTKSITNKYKRRFINRILNLCLIVSIALFVYCVVQVFI